MSLTLSPFKTLIKARCGLLFEGNNEDKLAQALAKRIEILAIKPAEYHARLKGSEAEFQELVNLLTINETYFFREPEHIRLLVDRLAPRFLSAHADKAPVRILSAGCSSGEEPYSLAMALTDKYGESVSRLFTFVGADIDSTILAKARQAHYSEFSFRGVPAELRTRYFNKDRHSHVLKEQIKSLVSFHELNLLNDSANPALHSFDIVFFRNVSIYFDAETRQRIQQNLSTLMKEDAVLISGTAETQANDLGLLRLVEEDGLFYFAKGKPPLPEEARPIAAHPSPLPLSLKGRGVHDPAAKLSAKEPGVHVPPAKLPPQKPPIDTARQLTRDKRYDEALPELDAVLAADPVNTEALLLKAHILINRQDFADAEALAQRVLAAEDWSIDALYLLGLAAKWRQQSEVAIRAFKQAAYAHHECWPAYYYLADLYRNSGETELARRAYRTVIQLLSSKEPDTGIQYVPLDLPTGEIRFLCERQLSKLPTAKALAEQR